MSEAILKNKRTIIAANNRDIHLAQSKGVSSALIDRLRLTQKRIKQMSDALRDIAHLRDILGETIKTWRRPNGLLISKVRVPIGVIGIIYESRPNVTADCIGLCLKTANAVVLRGGSEAINSNKVIFNTLAKIAKQVGIPDGAINMIKTTDRKAVDILLRQSNYLDLVIPRGGENLIRIVNEKSQIPVIKHYKGVCHTYIDSDANLKMAGKIAFNAKVQRPSVCNAMETLLVHKKIARRFLPSFVEILKVAGVKVKGCEHTRKIVKGVYKASARDWSEEYLDLVLSIKVVNNINEAIAHINRFGTRHSDAIVTDNRKNARYFLQCVDSACVYVNASTRFTDGGEFGLGAEMGISTDKIHARGPMGIEELTTYKYQITGSGQIRQ
jgi:glutamate-5-semialdehyde dehydrogenase